VLSHRVSTRGDVDLLTYAKKHPGRRGSCRGAWCTTELSGLDHLTCGAGPRRNASLVGGSGGVASLSVTPSSFVQTSLNRTVRAGRYCLTRQFAGCDGAAWTGIVRTAGALSSSLSVP